MKTEGIIQKLFKEVYRISLSEFPINYLRVEQLEQELISQILNNDFFLYFPSEFLQFSSRFRNLNEMPQWLGIAHPRPGDLE